MDLPTVWWVVAGIAVAVELLTGTIYLLMIAVGLAAGAIAAHAGVGLSAQLVLAGVIGSVASYGWHRIRGRGAERGPATANPDVNLDVGEEVTVAAWVDGAAQVKYRGSSWTALPRSGHSPVPGRHRIVEVSGNRLYVEPTERERGQP